MASCQNYSSFLFDPSDLAYRKPQALHSSFGPLGPLRHSGESLRWHFAHIFKLLLSFAF
jgi:hypothetical protein